MVRYCAKTLRDLARDFPSQREAILGDLEGMAKSWARALLREGAPWQGVLGLCDAARATARFNGRASFPPTIEEIIVEWEREQERAQQRERELEWSRHDEAQRAHGFATVIPELCLIHKKRGAAVVCRCEKNGIQEAAQLDAAAEYWVCRGLRGRPCNFRWPTSDTANAPLPLKSFGGLVAGDVAKQAAERPNRPAPAKRPAEVICDRFGYDLDAMEPLMLAQLTGFLNAWAGAGGSAATITEAELKEHMAAWMEATEERQRQRGTVL